MEVVLVRAAQLAILHKTLPLIADPVLAQDDLSRTFRDRYMDPARHGAVPKFSDYAMREPQSQRQCQSLEAESRT